jgi:hypothetical protein
MENQTITVRAVVAFPSLDRPIMFKGAPTEKYGLQLANLSDAAVDKLEELGIEVKSKEDDAYTRGKFLDIKSQYPIDNNGRFNMLFEADGQTLFEDFPSAIGYGSVVKARIRPYTTRQGDIKPSLVRLSVEELSRPESADNGDEVVL